VTGGWWRLKTIREIDPTVGLGGKGLVFRIKQFPLGEILENISGRQSDGEQSRFGESKLGKIPGDTTETDARKTRFSFEIGK